MSLPFDPTLIGIALALGLGLLIGIEREWQEAKPIGVRSFTLLSGLGATAAVLSKTYGGWVIAAAVIAAGTVIGVHLYRHREAPGGITTAIAALLCLLIGALATSALWLEAIVLAAAVMLLLHWKRPLHEWIERLGEGDFEIIARFTLIALVVLPVLPDQTYGPFEVFNPFRSWLLVVLIVALNIVGYLSFRFAGAASGVWVGGLVGGMISSTATTISYAGISKRQQHFGAAATVVILVASAVVYARVMVELFVVSPRLVPHAIVPLATFAGILLLLGALAFRWVKSRDVEMPEQRNPARFGLALSAGLIYLVILYAVALTRNLIGNEALYLVAAVSGLTDVDALTLSVGQLHAVDKVPTDVAWRSIFLATLANLVFKTGAACLLGSAALRWWMLAVTVPATVVGFLLLVLWP